MRIRIVALCAPGLLLSATGAAQPQVTDLAPIIVSASRDAEPAAEALASVSVIDREDIERQQPQSVLDLLRTQAGIDISTNGGLGSVSSVFMRGAESDQVLVLVDGVRAASSTAGLFSFQQLNPAQIERIEIVRGPRASLYGSDAIGGVIQVFTRKLDGPSASIEGGSYDTYRAQAGYGGGGDTVRYSVNGAYVDSDGFSASNEKAGEFVFDPDDDGYDEASVTASLDATLSERANLSVNGWHSDGKLELDQGLTDTRNSTIGLNLDFDTLPGWQQSFGFGYARDDQATDFSGFFSSAETDRVTFNWQNELSLGAAHQLTLGADYYRDAGLYADDSSAYDEDANDIGVYANLRSTFGRNDVQLGLRYDEHSEFGGHTTGQLALGRQLTESLRGFAAFGTAFRAPSLNDLFFPNFSNPELDPERSHSTELGVQFQPSAGHLFTADMFYTEIDDLIASNPPEFIPFNVEEATIKGLELGYAGSIATVWNLSANVTLQDARNDTDDTELVRRPDRKAAFGLARNFSNGGSIYTEVLLSGDRTDVGDVSLPGYGIVNLSLQYPLLDSLFAEARVENLLDKEYELASGFNTSDRAGYVGLRYTPAQAD